MKANGPHFMKHEFTYMVLLGRVRKQFNLLEWKAGYRETAFIPNFNYYIIPVIDHYHLSKISVYF